MPLDNRVRNKEFLNILIEAREFIGSLSLKSRQVLIVLFGFERRVPCFFRVILRIRNKYRKKSIGRDISFFQTLSKLGKRDVDHRLSKLHKLYPISYRDKLKDVCNEKFPAHKKWCYEDFRKLIKAALIETRIGSGLI